MDALSRFLRAQARRPFGWGDDCLMFGADWVLDRRGVDPAARWRGVYDDEAGAAAILTAGGGFEAMMRAALADLGILPTGANAVRGDIGLIRVMSPAGEADVCGICTGGRWAARSARGLGIGPASPRLVWPLGVESRDG